MKRTIAAVSTVLLLGACGTDITPKPKESSVDEVAKTLKDGRTVVCLIYAAGNRAGMSCDWESAR